VSVMPSGGLMPTSVTEDDGLVFVLNAGGDGNISGFVNLRGRLLPLANSTRGLSAAGGTAPAQVGFTMDGSTLVVAERATNKLTTYTVMDNGSLSTPQANPSVGMTPFGFAFNPRGHLLVSEAFGGAANVSAVTSYRFSEAAPRTPITISPSVSTMQTAACWVAITPNGRYAYTTNTASGSISLYRIEGNGRISLAQSVAAFTAGSGPLDASVSANGRSLYVLRGGTKAVAAYRIAGDGSLMGTGAVGVPMGSVGMAAT
jgi:6-phosphogluconolactonase